MIATICILVKNAGFYLVDLLNALDQQVLGEEFEAIDDCQLNRIEKNKITEDYSSSGYDPGKKNEEN